MKVQKIICHSRNARIRVYECRHMCVCVCVCKHGVLWPIRTVLASTGTHTGKTEKICMHAVINISCTSCHHILTIQLFTQCDSGACYAWRGVLRSQVKNQCDQSTILICTLACEPATQYTNESTKSPPFPSHFRSDYFCNSIIFFRCKVAFINRVSDKIVLVCSGYMLRFALVFVCVWCKFKCCFEAFKFQVFHGRCITYYTLDTPTAPHTHTHNIHAHSFTRC